MADTGEAVRMTEHTAEYVPRRWKGMTLRDELLEWRERALEAEAERDHLRSLVESKYDEPIDGGDDA